MLKKILTISLVTTLFACSSQTDTQTLALSDDPKAPVIQLQGDTTALTYSKLQNSKWIVGEVGVNGEQPDTIIFAKPDTLTYISTDTGKELCRYTFSKDTLTFYSHSVEADMNSLDDISCESENKLHYENGTFKYVYFDKKCTGDQVPKRVRMDTLDVRFKRF